jgi:hypothetical protein
MANHHHTAAADRIDGADDGAKIAWIARPVNGHEQSVLDNW